MHLTAVAVGAFLALGLAGVTHALLRRASARRGTRGMGPADRVTLLRAWLTCLVAGLLPATLTGAPTTWPVVLVATVALVLDGVDGRVARRTGTVSTFGARFDMEVDALLILVLSAHVAVGVGWWVVGLGLARYAVWLGAQAVPWLRADIPARYWRKVVAAAQGVALVVAASGLVTPRWDDVVLAVAATALALSFGTEVVERWRHWSPAPVAAGRSRRGSKPSGPVRRRRRVVGGVLTAALLWLAFSGPDRVRDLHPGVLLALPLDGIVLLAVLAVLRGRPRRWLVLTLGPLLGLVLVVRILDLGVDWALGRPFDPVQDWSYLSSATGLLADATSVALAVLVCTGLAVVTVGLLVALPWSLTWAAERLGRHRRRALCVAAILLPVWLACALTGVTGPGGAPVARAGAVGMAARHLDEVGSSLGDEAAFDRGLAADPPGGVPPELLPEGLRGKDVLLVFVESYGRVALEGPPEVIAPVTTALADADRRLSHVGWSSRSAWLTSPTFGGISWLAHSTLQTGLWVDGQGRYDRLLASNRTSLSKAFHEAGWRTVADIPSDTGAWPEGSRFYSYDRVYDAFDVGYAGPRLGYARVPDQFTLKTFAERELRPGHAPVMAEIDLVSSHLPWAPLPRLMDWRDVGSDSAYVSASGEAAGSRSQVWSTPAGVRAAYGRSVAYSLESLVSFVEAVHDDDLVLVVLGDHQPSAVVSGRRADHDVPASIIARDPEVVSRAAAWSWRPGMRPSHDAPVWRMDAFRDRFLTTYTMPAAATAAAAH